MNARCNNCGATVYKVLYSAGWAQKHQIVRCERCELMYAFPLSQNNLETYSIDVGDQVPLSEASPEVRRGLNKLPDYEKMESTLSSLLPSKGHIVEVGAHAGLLLRSFRERGWRVTGIEPDGRAVEFARGVYDIDVRNGTLLTTDLEDGCADAVIMLHVIEHLDDPAANLRVVTRILRDDGIFVVETPIYDTLTYRILGRRERNMSCDGHIFFYTEATLSRLLRDQGFKILRSKRVGRTMSLSRFISNIAVISKNITIQRILKAVSDRPSLHSINIHINARDMLRIYAQKSD